MTEKQARTEDLVFTGIWERNYNRNEAKKMAKEIREKYKCRAVLVNEDGGVSVYADKKYDHLKHLEHLECMLQNIPAARKKLFEQLVEVDEEENKLKEQIAVIKNMYSL